MAPKKKEDVKISFWPILVGAVVPVLAEFLFGYLVINVRDIGINEFLTFIVGDTTHFIAGFACVFPVQIALGAIIGVITRQLAKTERRAIWGTAIVSGIMGVVTGFIGVFFVVMTYI